MARPEYQRSDAEWNKILEYVAQGNTFTQIANSLGISVNTIKKYYPETSDEIARHFIETAEKTLMFVMQRVDDAQYTKQAVTAAIFTLKMRGGKEWSENREVDSEINVEFKISQNQPKDGIE